MPDTRLTIKQALSNKYQKSTRNQQKRAEDPGQKEQKMEDAGPTMQWAVVPLIFP